MAVSDDEPRAQQGQGEALSHTLASAAVELKQAGSGAKATPLATFFPILLLPLILLAKPTRDPSSLITGYKEDMQIPPEPPSRGEPSLSPAQHPTMQ